MTSLAAFIGVSALLIVTAGQDTALTIRNTLVGGRRGGPCTALGVSSGQAVWALGAAAGLAALLLLPRFADTFVGLLGLGLLFSAIAVVWLGAYASAVARAGSVLRRPRVRRALDAVTGFVLVAFGPRPATEQS